MVLLCRGAMNHRTVRVLKHFLGQLISGGDLLAEAEVATSNLEVELNHKRLTGALTTTEGDYYLSALMLLERGLHNRGWAELANDIDLLERRMERDEMAVQKQYDQL